MTDFTEQRLNMVDSQVRPSDVTDQRILRAMLEVPRERFVPPELADIAYIDGLVPVTARSNHGEPRCLLPARTFGKLLQLADIEPASVVLDVGCATGYSAAVLARLAERVVALEADRDLARSAAAAVQEMGLGNVKVVEGSLAAGAPADGRFDVILLNGAVPSVPAALLEQLTEGGRLVAMLDCGPLCRAHIWRRSGKTVGRQSAFEGAAARLPGFEKPAEFVL